MMTPEQYIKKEIILQAIKYSGFVFENEINESNIEEVYTKFREEDYSYDCISEFRSTGVETKMDTPYSRHYESTAMAEQMSDGKWVGWTYWYGGGKHSEPEAIEWMNEAYFLDCKEEEKMVIVRTFSKQ